MFLNVPAVSRLQYHPFTAVPSAALSRIDEDELDGNGKDKKISSGGSGGGGLISVFVKSMGEGSWTDDLRCLVERGAHVVTRQEPATATSEGYRRGGDDSLYSFEDLKSPLVASSSGSRRRQ